MNDDNEQRENENLVQPPRILQERKLQNNRGWWIILKVPLYAITILMVVSAFVMSAVAINQMPVKYTTYERIGNKKCPDISGTTTIYSGVTISYSYNNNNIPTTYPGFRCMPTNDEDINYYTGSLIYTKDQVYNGNATGYITFINSNYHGGAACAVCMVEGRGSIVVLPGTNKCKDPSWTKEYNGYLMTGNTCVDIHMEYLPDSKIPDSVDFLRHEVISSGVSDCYKDNTVLSCAVCSK